MFFCFLFCKMVEKQGLRYKLKPLSFTKTIQSHGLITSEYGCVFWNLTGYGRCKYLGR